MRSLYVLVVIPHTNKQGAGCNIDVTARGPFKADQVDSKDDSGRASVLGFNGVGPPRGGVPPCFRSPFSFIWRTLVSGGASTITLETAGGGEQAQNTSVALPQCPPQAFRGRARPQVTTIKRRTQYAASLAQGGTAILHFVGGRWLPFRRDLHSSLAVIAVMFGRNDSTAHG